ncbi:MAG: HAD family phosphatase [Roseiflexaceae bacterium]|nr:HAD family phosphatase [Roseiflexaceae bacterium]
MDEQLFAKPIAAVIFDRDHTLLHFDLAAIAHFEQRIHSLLPEIPLGAAAAHWQAWRGPWPQTIADEEKFWILFWESLAQQYQVSAERSIQLQQFGPFYHTCFVAYPDTLACLQSLRTRGLRLAVLTNFELPSIHLTLQHVGIDPGWFDALISSTAIGLWKPNPQAYLNTAETLGVAPSACLFVDDLEENVEGAQAVGMHAILIDRKKRSTYSGTRIFSLHELAQFI